MYTFTYIYIYMYTCIVCTHVLICIYVNEYTCMYIYMYTYIYIYMYVCIYWYICVYIYVYTCKYVWIYIHTYMYAYIYLYICTYTTFIFIFHFCCAWQVRHESAIALGSIGGAAAKLVLRELSNDPEPVSFHICMLFIYSYICAFIHMYTVYICR